MAAWQPGILHDSVCPVERMQAEQMKSWQESRAGWQGPALVLSTCCCTNCRQQRCLPWLQIAVSDAALLAVVSGLISLGRSMGWMWLTKTYIIPYLMVNMWLVMITLLQVRSICCWATGAC